MKYYVIKGGVNEGIYNSWSECQKKLKDSGYQTYKSFSEMINAKNFLEDKPVQIKPINPTAYIDGSYSSATNEYSFGCVFLYKGKEYQFFRKFPEDELSSMRNVAGEIKGAAYIIQYCINRGIEKLDLYYDYEGIAKWYNGLWKANLYGTKKYVEFAEQAKKMIKVEFHKIKSHSNDHYNDLADGLAKKALGIN